MKKCRTRRFILSIWVSFLGAGCGNKTAEDHEASAKLFDEHCAETAKRLAGYAEAVLSTDVTVRSRAEHKLQTFETALQCGASRVVVDALDNCWSNTDYERCLADNTRDLVKSLARRDGAFARDANSKAVAHAEYCERLSSGLKLTASRLEGSTLPAKEKPGVRDAIFANEMATCLPRSFDLAKVDTCERGQGTECLRELATHVVAKSAD